MTTSKFLTLTKLTLIVILLSSSTPPELSVDTYSLNQPSISEDPSLSTGTDDIRLAAGDILTVDLWGHDSMTKQVTVDAAGNIYYPFIGKVKATGLTIEQLRSTVTTQLSTYYLDPTVSIIPDNLAGQHYYILGEVNNTGEFIIKGQTAVFEAIASAGGPNQDGADIVVLLRKKEDTLQIFSIPLQYRGFTENNILSTTMLIHANDVLYLPPRTIADVERFMTRINNILNPLLAIERAVLYWPQLIEAIEGTSSDILIQ